MLVVVQSLLNIMLDEDYGDITDPLSGRDVKVVCTKPPGRQWATTEVRPRGKASKLTENTSQSEQFIGNIPSLDDLFSLKSYEELEKIVNDWLNGESSDSSDDFGTTRNISTTANVSTNQENTSEASNKKYKSLDDAFADLEDL